MTGRMRYFHGSCDYAPPGTVFRGRGDAYEQFWKITDFYLALERWRPPAALAHRDAVFMVASPGEVEDASARNPDWIMEMAPRGAVARYDMNWCSLVAGLVCGGAAIDSPEVRNAAEGYWSGLPHPRRDPLWEYLAAEAEVLRVAPFADFHAGAPEETEVEP